MNRKDRLEKQLIELNNNKDKFFSIIGHDLKGPIFAAQQLSTLIKDEPLHEEERSQITEMMDKSIKRVSYLLEELLEWSRIQMHRVDFSPQRLKVYKIVQEAIDHLSIVAENKHVQIHDRTDHRCMAFGDKYMVLTVVRNLLSNAIKFTHAGNNVFINCTNKKGRIEVSVKDEGIGMSDKHKEKLFKLDAVASREGTMHETGSGLGLIISKEFVEKNGGTIWVESKEGKGSTFTFTLPVA